MAGAIRPLPGLSERSDATPIEPSEANAIVEVGGPDRDRTGDLLNAIQARSQLRYRPILRRDDPLL